MGGIDNHSKRINRGQRCTYTTRNQNSNQYWCKERHQSSSIVIMAHVWIKQFFLTVIHAYGATGVLDDLPTDRDRLSEADPYSEG